MQQMFSRPCWVTKASGLVPHVNLQPSFLLCPISVVASSTASLLPNRTINAMANCLVLPVFVLSHKAFPSHLIWRIPGKVNIQGGGFCFFSPHHSQLLGLHNKIRLCGRNCFSSLAVCSFKILSKESSEVHGGRAFTLMPKKLIPLYGCQSHFHVLGTTLFNIESPFISQLQAVAGTKSSHQASGRILVFED